MTFVNLSGQLPAGVGASQVGSNGLKAFSASSALAADDLNNTYKDVQLPLTYLLQPGVTTTGSITASGLVVSFPSGFAFFAQNVWTNNATVTTTVTDGTTTYIWGCSDGNLRKTSSSTQPTGYTGSGSCLLCSATASGGTATIDISAQQLSTIGNKVNASATAGAATANADKGTVTSENLTTAAGSSYTLTITNNRINAASLVFVSVANGTNTASEITSQRVTPAAGSVVIIVKNTGSAAWNGTLKISFFVQ